ncbi:MAG: hypothetical protein ACQEP8_03070 [Chlamydiota bacterium]
MTSTVAMPIELSPQSAASIIPENNFSHFVGEAWGRSISIIKQGSEKIINIARGSLAAIAHTFSTIEGVNSFLQITANGAAALVLRRPFSGRVAKISENTRDGLTFFDFIRDGKGCAEGVTESAKEWSHSSLSSKAKKLTSVAGQAIITVGDTLSALDWANAVGIVALGAAAIAIGQAASYVTLGGLAIMTICDLSNFCNAIRNGEDLIEHSLPLIKDFLDIALVGSTCIGAPPLSALIALGITSGSVGIIKLLYNDRQQWSPQHCKS